MSSTHSLLRLSGIVEESVVDGPGLRLVIFTQGCPHACPGCHNPHTHDPAGGYSMNLAELSSKVLAEIQANPLLSGVTFSGGEPFTQAPALLPLARATIATGKNLLIYTGYKAEHLRSMAHAQPEIGHLLDCAHILIDGPYIEAQRDLELPFWGSSNQRLLHKGNF